MFQRLVWLFGVEQNRHFHLPMTFQASPLPLLYFPDLPGGLNGRNSFDSTGCPSLLTLWCLRWLQPPRYSRGWRKPANLEPAIHRKLIPIYVVGFTLLVAKQVAQTITSSELTGVRRGQQQQRRGGGFLNIKVCGGGGDCCWKWHQAHD